MTIHDHLAPLIREAGIRTTSRATGIHPSSLSAWCMGKRRLNDQQIDALASFLGVKFRSKRTSKQEA